MGKNVPTALGALLLNRMTELGMRYQADLVRQAADLGHKLSDSTVSRLLYNDFHPDPPTLRALAAALDIDLTALVLYVYGIDGGEVRPALDGAHPLAVEIGRMLAGDSPIPAADREMAATILDRVVEPYRPLMRRRRTA